MKLSLGSNMKKNAAAKASFLAFVLGLPYRIPL